MALHAERLVEPAGREPAPGALRKVQLFVNSVNIEEQIELFDRPEVVGQWFIDKNLSGQPVVGSDVELAWVIKVREALRGLLIGNHDGSESAASDVEVIESAGRAAGLGIGVSSTGDVGITTSASGLDAALGELLVIVVESSLSGRWPRLKACSNDVCRWVFWDGSRNHSSRWCSMALCGNKAKVRAHRQRRSTT